MTEALHVSQSELMKVARKVCHVYKRVVGRCSRRLFHRS